MPEWFYLTVRGIKKFDYREDKSYWQSRLSIKLEVYPFAGFKRFVDFKRFDEIRYTNGYGKHRPWCRLKWKGVDYIHGGDHVPACGEPLKPTMYFRVHNGEILEKGNIQ